MVPVLRGAANWQSWEPLMKAFLMGQGQWFILTIPAVTPEWQKVKEVYVDKDGDTKERSVEDRSLPPDNVDEYKSWSADNWKALGNINLRLDPAIRYKYSAIEKSGDLWATLKSEFGKPGIAATYHEFKTALTLSLPENSDPSRPEQTIWAFRTNGRSRLRNPSAPPVSHCPHQASVLYGQSRPDDLSN